MDRFTTIASLCALSAMLGCSGARQKKLEQQQQEQAKVEARAQSLAQNLAVQLADRARSDEDTQKAAQVKAERALMQKNPKDYFETSGLRIIRAPDGMRSIQALTLTNKSRFAVQQVVARVDFMKDGLPTAQIPLQLTGTLPAGATRTFTVGDKTLAGATVETDANETDVSVTSVVLAPDPGSISAALMTE